MTLRVSTYSGCVVLTIPVHTGELYRWMLPTDARELAAQLTEHADRLTPGHRR